MTVLRTTGWGAAILLCVTPPAAGPSQSGNCLEAQPQPQCLYTVTTYFGLLEVFFYTIRY